ncbi:DUF1579 domain-containing protein [Paucibacter sp. PLA-PC-4]|uniref:DUF1579 domain-containing protein n=1 Tax=Paucibacter sp. PLA-PC-4 TaxID=2993655 RepID=UPI0022489144|nr:DUF1579 domain-containing protein [Paucibacter sp. PLA-PC-4]MCX2862324.1 DUF1579 domain-containing protein [Paucibacter sp. PLA-PC-4]
MSQPRTAPADFDFIIGHWTVRHRRLRERLAGCNEWQEFSGSSSTRKILDGFGNVEDNLLHLPEGEYRAAALRSFDPVSGQWAIWWLDGRRPHGLDVPVVGRFAEGVGSFFADDELDGRPIRVRFTWSVPALGLPRWEQAFSADAGQTWETNWTMDFSPALDDTA